MVRVYYYLCGDEAMKKYVLTIFSVLISVSLLACSSSKVVTENKNISIDKKAPVNKSAIVNNITIKNSKNSIWTNKDYVSIGDSITWQDQKGYPGTKIIATGYQSLLNEKIGFKSVVNLGISGATIAKSSFYPKRDSLLISYQVRNYSKADIITIFGGTNDFKLNVPLGKMGMKKNKNYDISTFYGSYEKLLNYILKQNNTVKIYLFTPLQRDNSGYGINKVNSAGVKLIDYVNAIKNIGELYNLPVLDLYSTSGINIYNLKEYTRDGLHPTDEGYRLITKPILDFIDKSNL